ncbi:hypothetical protein RS694_01405 [Rhodoferax saidenbachensis]|uniref:ABC-type transport auxiliary lipoprotein component domain-containing protein n=2 Tax=Rhodoferax saidenbachensis TaxID=1484693 RepID=A0A1P8KF82_9BURK|nr:ABC-type transport auxiliary lipoprotein family protein [Rhodoferax saidenbachensis]APW44642.1 hypothetical protein RS694_01405 [Rhodoferax saidenbachensis]
MLAACAHSIRAGGLFVFVLLGLSACSSLQAPARPLVYDFGPGAVATEPTNRMARLPTLSLAEVDAGAALDGTAVLYRLAYADGQQLRPYAQARWSMPPAQLLRQRLREQLGQRRAVLNLSDGLLAGRASLTLHVELEEFSQLFEAADRSSGLVRLRATLGHVRPEGAGGGPAGERLVAQRSFVVQRPAASADAAGGVRALTQASDALIEELEQWIAQVQQAAASR